MTTFVLRAQSDAATLWSLLKEWAQAARRGKPLVVFVTAYDKPQTRRQQMRYRALLRTVAENAWLDGERKDADWWHGWFAGEYLGTGTDDDGIPRTLSTLNLTCGEMNEYQEWLAHEAQTTLGVDLSEIP